MWVFFALAASMVNAIYYLINQNIRLKPSIFMIYRGWIVALMVIPFLFFYDTIAAWQFYAIAITQGCITAYNDYKSLKANRKYGAETVCSIIPINLSFIFLIWCFIEPMIIIKYAQSPLKSAFILLSLCGIIYALTKYRKVKIAREAFVYLIPLMFLSAMISIFNKTIMNYAQESLLGLCFWRIFITSLTVGTIHLFIYFRREKTLSQLVEKDNLCKCWIFIFMPLSMIFRNMAMYYTINPSYVAAIVQTSLLWIMFFNRYMPFIHCKKMCMQMDKKWAILMLASVIILLIATR